MIDSERLDFLEDAVKRSLTGASFDWVPSVEGEPSGFRFITHQNIREPHSTIRNALDAAISQDRR